MDDECPHRRAPLSRGRLYQPKGGSSSSSSGSGHAATGGGCGVGGDVLLECAYHGWQFDGAGTCVHVPQLLPPGYDSSSSTHGGSGGGTSSNGAGAGSGSSGAGHAAAGGGAGAAAAPTAQPPRTSPPRRAAPPPTCSGRAYDTAVRQGMLWVWYGKRGAGDPEAIPIDFAEEGLRRGEDWALVDVFSRDFPYDWETMVENVVDPAHVAFAHDGTGQGLDRHDSPPLELQVTEAGPTGFTGRFRGVRATPAGGGVAPGAWSALEFRPPCLVSMRFGLPGKGEAGLVLYCVPTGRGRSRMLARLPRNFATGLWARLKPRWAKHLPRMAVLDQDIDLLREQEAAMRRHRWLAATATATAAAVDGGGSGGSGGGGGGAAEEAAAVAAAAAAVTDDWRRLYVMPAPADRFVVQFRRWLGREGGGGPPWAGAGGSRGGGHGAAAAAAAPAVAAAAQAWDGGGEQSREAILDRYHSHVAHCSACSGALANFQRLAAVATVMAVAATAAAAGLAATAAVHHAATAAAPTAAAAAAAAAAAVAGGAAAGASGAAVTVAAAAAAAAANAAMVATAVAAMAAAVAAWARHMAGRFRYTEEGRQLRMNENRWLRRLLFSGTNSFNSMVALTAPKPTAASAAAQPPQQPPPPRAAAAGAAGAGASG